MKIGVVGLPNVGKSTLFNAITKAGAEAANYPFCTIEPNVGIAPVPDIRLEALTKLYNAKNTIPAACEFVDIAGIVKGASKGEGLGNKFLSHIREVDAVAHVVRCFSTADVIHVNNTVDPVSDAEIINMELILADLESIEKRREKAQKAVKTGDKNAETELSCIEKIKTALESGKTAKEAPLTEAEQKFVRGLFLLSSKPTIYVANVDEADAGKSAGVIEAAKSLCEYAKKQGAGVVAISAKIEDELNALSPEEAEIFLEDLGIKERGLNKLISAGYNLLGLMSFLTAGEKEVRAWTIRKGAKAPEAAGVIHTDFEKGFIKAEVVNFNDLVACGSMVKAKEKGLVRIEGKDYVVQDGDVMLFRFNV